MSRTRSIRISVNGTPYERTVDVRLTLADFLRGELELTGTHIGCEHGVCGACTVLVDGRTARSCLMLAVQANGHETTTVEGLGDKDDPQGLGLLQQCFHEHHALQCGFCTAGILITLHEFLRDVPEPSAEDVREVLSGHLCRCTGYEPIVAACLDAAKRMAARGMTQP